MISFNILIACFLLLILILIILFILSIMVDDFFKPLFLFLFCFGFFPFFAYFSEFDYILISKNEYDLVDYSLLNEFSDGFTNEYYLVNYKDDNGLINNKKIFHAELEIYDVDNYDNILVIEEYLGYCGVNKFISFKDKVFFGYKECTKYNYFILK